MKELKVKEKFQVVQYKCILSVSDSHVTLVLPGQRVFPAKSNSHRGHCPVTLWLIHSSLPFISLPFSWT